MIRDNEYDKPWADHRWWRANFLTIISTAHLTEAVSIRNIMDQTPPAGLFTDKLGVHV